MKRFKISTSISSLALLATIFTLGGEGFGGASAYASDLGSKGGLKDAPVVSGGSHPISWTGFYIGGQAGYGNTNHKLSFEDQEGVDGKHHHCDHTNAVGPVTSVPDADGVCAAGDVFVPTEYETVGSEFIDGLNSRGIFGGLTIGGDFQRGNFVFGGFADYNISGAETKIGGSEVGVGSVNSTLIEEGDSWLIAARAGYLFGEEKRALLYVLGGYGQSDMTYKGINDGKDKDVTFSGFVAGAGAEYALTQNVFLGLEYQHFFGGKEEIFNSDPKGIDCDREVVSDDVSSDKVMAKLKVKLNGGLFD